MTSPSLSPPHAPIKPRQNPHHPQRLPLLRQFILSANLFLGRRLLRPRHKLPLQRHPPLAIVFIAALMPAPTLHRRHRVRPRGIIGVRARPREALDVAIGVINRVNKREPRFCLLSSVLLIFTGSARSLASILLIKNSL